MHSAICSLLEMELKIFLFVENLSLQIISSFTAPYSMGHTGSLGLLQGLLNCHFMGKYSLSVAQIVLNGAFQNAIFDPIYGILGLLGF